jgi:hypothetical protein
MKIYPKNVYYKSTTNPNISIGPLNCEKLYKDYIFHVYPEGTNAIGMDENFF